MSTTSVGSQSVSLFGGEYDGAKAIDLVFRELQNSLNQAGTLIREMLLIEERNDTFMEAAEIHENLLDYLDGLGSLMKSCKDVSKELLGKCPKELKAEYKQYVEQRKIERKKQIEEDEKKYSSELNMTAIMED